MASVVITSVAMWFVLHKMKAQRLGVVRDRRRRLQGEAGLKGYEEGRVPLTAGHHGGGSSSSIISDEVFNPGISDAELAGRPIEVGYNDRERYRYDYDRRGGPVAPTPQRWDERGHAIEMSNDSYNDPYSYNAYPPSKKKDSQKGSPALGPVPIPALAPIPPPITVAAPTQQTATYAPVSSPPPHLRAGVNPYGGITSPPKQQTYLPPLGPPPPVVHQLQTSTPIPVPGTLSIPPPPAPASAAATTTSSVPASSYATAQLLPSINVSQAEPESAPLSPFEDKYAIQIPSHVRRYQLSDGSNDFRSTQYSVSEREGSGTELLPQGGGHYPEATDSTFYSAHSRTGTDASDADLR